MAEYYATGRRGHGGNDGENRGSSSSSRTTSREYLRQQGDQEPYTQQERMALIIQKGLSLAYEGHKAKEADAKEQYARSRSTASYYYYGNLFD
uniref:Uncharacterized protein n=1 Tax=Oryza punctata TaxID=4537 RepID=A0A0E0JU01_ORYPU